MQKVSKRGRFCPWLQKQITKMKAITQLFYLLPCKGGTKAVFSRTDPTSESLFRLGSFQLLLEAKAFPKCLPRASQWFSSFEGSHCAVSCVCLLGAGEEVKGTSDPQLIFLPWVQKVWSTGSPIPATLVSEEASWITALNSCGCLLPVLPHSSRYLLILWWALVFLPDCRDCISQAKAIDVESTYACSLLYLWGLTRSF